MYNDTDHILIRLLKYEVKKLGSAFCKDNSRSGKVLVFCEAGICKYFYKLCLKHFVLYLNN